MPKLSGMAMAAGGALLLIGSMLCLNYPDGTKWFPVLLIGGGVLVWFGIQKYRAAY
jgi:hypothetical protein